MNRASVSRRLITIVETASRPRLWKAGETRRPAFHRTVRGHWWLTRQSGRSLLSL